MSEEREVANYIIYIGYDGDRNEGENNEVDNGVPQINLDGRRVTKSLDESVQLERLIW